MPKATSSSDLAFVECAQSGDAGAFDYLVLRHRADLLRLLAQHVSDPAQAEHLADETFRRAYRALAGFPHKVHFFTWLSRIAVDTAARARDSRGLPARTEAESPAPEALTDEMRNSVRDTLARLPRELRAALLMREHDGLSYEEIAAVLKCPVRTVRSFVFLARTAIDERLRALAPLEPAASEA
jgi:RNA polymerase sigma-70 factor, ECF subfamily